MMDTSQGIALFLTELKVADWPRTVRWYVEALGLRIVLEDAAHQYALLEAGGARIALTGGGAPDRDRGACRLVFLVADVDDARARLSARGEAVGAPLDNLAEGYREARLTDPEGTPITLFCWSDGGRDAKGPRLEHG